MNFRRGAALAPFFVLVLLALFELPALAADSNVRVIEVDGIGEVRATPDVAHLSLQIETHAPTAEECSAKNAALAQKVVQQLKNKLAGKGNVLTGDYSLNPEYTEPGPRQKIVGYSAQNTITVETSELALLGALIDGAIAAGANRINYLNFALRDDIKAREQAIANASKDAQAQAQALAASLGVKLKHVVRASTVPERGPIMPMRGAAAFTSANVTTPIEANQVTITATVSLTYEIE